MWQFQTHIVPMTFLILNSLPWRVRIHSKVWWKSHNLIDISAEQDAVKVESVVNTRIDTIPRWSHLGFCHCGWMLAAAPNQCGPSGCAQSHLSHNPRPWWWHLQMLTLTYWCNTYHSTTKQTIQLSATLVYCIVNSNSDNHNERSTCQILRMAGKCGRYNYTHTIYEHTYTVGGTTQMWWCFDAQLG